MLKSIQQISRISLISVCLVACIACAEAPSDLSVIEKVKPAKPNVIVILADDLKLGLTGYENHPFIKTPNIDYIASKGTVFTSGFATSAVCTPSRTSLLTGLYERRHGVNFNSNSSLTENAYQKTYPMLLKQAGYFVGYVGKNHTPIGRNEDGVTGYKSGVMDTSFDYWYASHKHLKFYPKDIKRHAIFKNAKADTQVEIIEEGVENFMAPDVAFQAGYDFLGSRPQGKPFALLINFNVPHASSTGSMEQRENDLELYKSVYRDQIEKLVLPETYVPYLDIKTPKLPQSVYNGKYLSSYDYVKTEETLREHKIKELQTITGIDKLVGKLLEDLEEQGVADNTIIVFTSDHGLMHGEFGLGGKVHLYDPSIRIPLVVYDPRIPQNSKAPHNDDLVALIDIAPTLLDLTDTPVPEDYQGTSLKPLLNGKSVQWRQSIFLENLMTIQNYPRMEAVRTHQWKYIRYFDKNKAQKYAQMSMASIKGEKPIYEELFDLQSDPLEIHNVVADPANAEVLEQLRQQNAQLVKEYRGDKPFDTYVNN
ncbi:MAG: sulfatase-like hydrolase/transferase [Glaciecola sp.]